VVSGRGGAQRAQRGARARRGTHELVRRAGHAALGDAAVETDVVAAAVAAAEEAAAAVAAAVVAVIAAVAALVVVALVGAAAALAVRAAGLVEKHGAL
jgi:hypothetical protein